MYSLSRGAPSATRPPLRNTGRIIPIFTPLAKPKITEKLMAWFLVLLFLNPLINLLAMHRNLLRSIHTNTNLVTLDAQHGDSHIVTHHQGLSDPASQNQHSFLLKRILFSKQSAKIKTDNVP